MLTLLSYFKLLQVLGIHPRAGMNESVNKKGLFIILLYFLFNNIMKILTCDLQMTTGHSTSWFITAMQIYIHFSQIIASYNISSLL